MTTSLIFCVFLLLCIIALLFMNTLYRRTNHYYNTSNETGKYLKQINDSLDIVNTGSTFAYYAFDYNDIGIRGFNFALKPQFLRYDDVILKKYASKLSKDAVVLICVADFALLIPNSSQKKLHDKYYRFLRNSEINNASAIRRIIIKYLPVCIELKNFGRFMFDCGRDEDYYVNPNDKEFVSASADAYVDGWCREFGFNNLVDASQDLTRFDNRIRDSIQHIESMIKTCREHSAHPVFILLPASECVENKISLDFMEKTLVSQLKKIDTSVPILNYTQNRKLQNYLLYRDAFCLNGAGRRVFTKIVIADLKAAGYMSNKEKGS